MEDMNNLKVSINTKHGIVRISRPIIKALGDPENVRLLIDVDTHQIAIQIADHTDKARIKVPYDEIKGFRFQLNSKALTEPIAKFMKWDQQSTYQVFGEQINDMIVFVLDNAEKNERTVDCTDTGEDS